MSKSITQDMAYRKSTMKYAEKYGVSRASRKYNKNRSYIYFWKARWNGSVESLVCQSRRPHSHESTIRNTAIIRYGKGRKVIIASISPFTLSF